MAHFTSCQKCHGMFCMQVIAYVVHDATGIYLLHFRSAKEKQLRIWKDYQPPAMPATVPIKTKEFTAKVLCSIT